MEYKDFNIRIMAKREDGYEVMVDSPAGSGNAVINLPFDIPEALSRIKDIGGNIRGDSTREAEFESSETMTPAAFGSELYQALFSGAVGKMYDRSYARMKPDEGLRIKLHLNLDDPKVSELSQIPWEYVYEADTMEYLTLSRQTPLVRYIEVQRSLTTHKLKGDLRILVVMSSPNGVAELDLEKERNLIDKTWANEDNVSVDFLEHPTPESLLEALTKKNYHVLHYMGHGAYDHKTGAGALILEDENHDAMMFDPQTLGTYLRDAPTIRLVFLNACDTGKSDEDEPFAGVANRLVMAGVPAVVAMQFPISDEAAIDFSRSFYSRLVAGFPVDEAMSQGRKSILAGRAGTIEWGTPVLYMRAPDGVLFDPTATQTEPATPTAAPAGDTPPPVAPTPPSSAAATGGAVPGSMGKIVGGGVAVVAAIVAGVFFWPTGGGVNDWDFSKDPPFEVGDMVKLNFGIKDKNGAVTPASNTHDVVMDPSGEGWTATRLETGSYSWEILMTASGATEFRATAKQHADQGAGEPIAHEVLIAVNQGVQDDYTHAMEAITGNLGSIEVLGLLRASSDKTVATDDHGDRLSTIMRSALTEAIAEFGPLIELQADAAAMQEDQDTPLSERINALERWKTTFEDVRYEINAGNTHPLDNSLTELQGRSNIDSITLCATYNCSRSIEQIDVNATLYVGVSPDIDGLTCQISGPQTKECRININSNRQLNNRGTYTVAVRNAEGDLLMTQDIVSN